MKIIGSGFIARSLKFRKSELKNYILYAKGVSNSLSKSKRNFARDKYTLYKEIKKIKKNKIFIYISTCSITDPLRKKNMYVKHKINMEKIVKSSADNYLILRLPEVIGKSRNNNTLINFFREKIINNKKFNLWKNVKRNIINIVHVKKILFIFLKQKKHQNQTINIGNTIFFSAEDIVKVLEKVYRKKSIYVYKNFSLKSWPINLNSTLFALKKSGIKFGKNYLIKNLKKN